MSLTNEDPSSLTQKKFVLDECMPAIKHEVLVDVLNEIIDETPEENIVEMLDQYKMIMRAIIIMENFIKNRNTSVGDNEILELVYKLVNKGAWKNEIHSKGIKIFVKTSYKKVDFSRFDRTPKEYIDELKAQGH